MKEILKFPGLGFDLAINRVAFSVGGFDVYWYGITFALAFALGLWYFYTHCRDAGVHPDDGLDVILWGMIGGIVGARLYYVAFQWDMYKNNLLKIFALREGGLAFYGGVIGGLLAALIVCKVKKLRVLPLTDVGLTALLLGQGVGRWGNFFNMEAFGCNTDLPWGMTSKSIQAYLTENLTRLESEGMTIDPSKPVHPCFLYEFLWCMLGFVFLACVIRPRRRYDGELTLWYIVWNGFGRFFIEGLRTDSLMWGTVRVSQVLGAVMFAAGALALIVLAAKRHKDMAALATVSGGAAEAAPADAEAAETVAEAVETAAETVTEAEPAEPETAEQAVEAAGTVAKAASDDAEKAADAEAVNAEATEMTAEAASDDAEAAEKAQKRAARWTLYRDTEESCARIAAAEKKNAEEKEKEAEKKAARKEKAEETAEEKAGEQAADKAEDIEAEPEEKPEATEDKPETAEGEDRPEDGGKAE